MLYKEIKQTWQNKKQVLQKNKPAKSNFTFFVCIIIVSTLGIGFLGGFLIAGFALNENYSSIYASLLKELEDTRSCVLQEKDELQKLKTVHVTQVHANQVREQAILSAFGSVFSVANKYGNKDACAEIQKIIDANSYNSEWRSQAKWLIEQYCKD